MVTVARAIIVDAAPEVVWSVVSQVEHLPRWLATARGAQSLGGSGLGRRQRVYGRRRGGETETDQRVVAWEPPRLLAWENEAERLDGEPMANSLARLTRLAVRLDPEGEGTRVTLESGREPANLWKGLVLRYSNFRLRQTQKVLDASLEKLAALVAR